MIDKRLYNFSGNIKKYISITTFLSCVKLIANIFFYFIFAFLLVSLINKDFFLIDNELFFVNLI